MLAPAVTMLAADRTTTKLCVRLVKVHAQEDMSKYVKHAKVNASACLFSQGHSEACHCALWL